jgi:hypothetical protein
MGTRVPEGFGEAVFKFRMANDPEDMLVTWGIKAALPGPVDQGDAECLADAMIGTLLQGMSSAVTFTGLDLRMGPDGLGQVFVVSRNSPGLEPGLPLVNNTTFLMRKSTGFGGRRNRGRSYLPGPIEASVAGNGAIDAAYRNAMQIRADAFIGQTVLCPNVALNVLFHTTTELEPGLPPTTITGVTIADKVATQRRRLRP